MSPRGGVKPFPAPLLPKLARKGLCERLLRTLSAQNIVEAARLLIGFLGRCLSTDTFKMGQRTDLTANQINNLPVICESC